MTYKTNITEIIQTLVVYIVLRSSSTYTHHNGQEFVSDCPRLYSRTSQSNATYEVGSRIYI